MASRKTPILRLGRPGGFPLGEPPRDNVDAAARLFLRYEAEAPLSRDHAAMFIQMCARPSDVVRRVTELQNRAAELLEREAAGTATMAELSELKRAGHVRTVADELFEQMEAEDSVREATTPGKPHT